MNIIAELKGGGTRDLRREITSKTEAFASAKALVKSAQSDVTAFVVKDDGFTVKRFPTKYSMKLI